MGGNAAHGEENGQGRIASALGRFATIDHLKFGGERDLRQRKERAMVVGVGIITFRIHDCRSLKGKRKVVKSIIARMRNNFNAAVAEVGANDIYQRAEIGFSVVGNDRGRVNAKLDKMFNMAEELGLAEIVETDLEIINL